MRILYFFNNLRIGLSWSIFLVKTIVFRFLIISLYESLLTHLLERQAVSSIISNNQIIIWIVKLTS